MSSDLKGDIEMASVSEVKQSMLDTIATKTADPTVTTQDLASLAGALASIAYIQEPSPSSRTKKK